MSTSSQVPSSASDGRGSPRIISLRVGHVVDAVERGDEVDASRRSAAAARAGRRTRALATPALGQLLAARGRARTARCRSPVNVLRRERLGHQQHRAPGAAADVGDASRRARSLSTTPSSAGSTTGQQERAVPRLEAALDADRALRAVAVVVVADAGAEALRHVLERAHRLRQAVEHAHAVRRVVRGRPAPLRPRA